MLLLCLCNPYEFFRLDACRKRETRMAIYYRVVPLEKCTLSHTKVTIFLGTPYKEGRPFRTAPESQ